MQKKHRNLLWGLLLIFLAVYLVTGKLGIIKSVGLLAGASLFDIILGILFLVLVINGIARLSYEQIFFSLAFLGIIFDKQLHIEEITPWTILLAALLVSIAMNMIFPKSKRNYKETKHTFFTSHGNLEGEKLFFKNAFGESTKYIKSDNFLYGDFSTSFGELNIYLTDAIIQENSATIDISVKFGQMTLFIPKYWRVDCRVSKTFGDIDIRKNLGEDLSAKILILQGDVSFGELEIIYI